MQQCLSFRFDCQKCGMQALAQEVACYLGMDLGGIKIKRFADGEIYVQVQVGICTRWRIVPVCGCLLQPVV